jgi:hypothetical protein
MAIDPNVWLVVEQVMEDENHILLQAVVTFASQASCPIIATMSRTVKIAGGGSLSSDAISGLIQFRKRSLPMSLSCSSLMVMR